MNDTDFIPHEPSYTVDEFCKAERISRVKLYELWNVAKARATISTVDAGASRT